MQGTSEIPIFLSRKRHKWLGGSVSTVIRPSGGPRLFYLSSVVNTGNTNVLVLDNRYREVLVQSASKSTLRIRFFVVFEHRQNTLKQLASGLEWSRIHSKTGRLTVDEKRVESLAPVSRIIAARLVIQAMIHPSLEAQLSSFSLGFCGGRGEGFPSFPCRMRKFNGLIENYIKARFCVTVFLQKLPYDTRSWLVILIVACFFFSLAQMSVAWTSE